MDAAAATDGTTLLITNTTAADRMLSFTNFDNAYLRNGAYNASGGIIDLSSPGMTVKANTCYLVHITENTNGATSTYNLNFNAAEAGGGGIAKGIGPPTTARTTPNQGGDVYVDQYRGDIYTYNSATHTWVKSNAGLVDADGDTRIQVEETGDEDIIRFDTRSVQRMVIDSLGNVGIGVSTPTVMLDVGGSARITGALKDSKDKAGSAGQLLSSTGSSTE